MQSSGWKTTEQVKSVVSSTGLAQENFENKLQKAENRTAGEGLDKSPKLH